MTTFGHVGAAGKRATLNLNPRLPRLIWGASIVAIPSGAESLMAPDDLLAELRTVREAVAAVGATILAGWQNWLERPRSAESAANLAGYLALCHRDLRPIQTALMALGVSSLGRAEARVPVNLDATLASLAAVGEGSGDTGAGRVDVPSRQRAVGRGS